MRALQRTRIFFTKIFPLFFLLFVSTQAQITVRLDHPPPGKLNVEDLWNFYITNMTEQTYTVYLRGTAAEETEGLIFGGNSQEFTIEPGFSGKIGLPEISPIDVDYTNKEYEDMVRMTGSVPGGFYRVCLSVVQVESNEQPT